ncbi:MAG: type II toxin-antitoxin system RelE/ParE family toxin [Prolixibacteraceae bacterium]|nr:type II toxin-antitoxin system RelE/ParE family toxin [Prolixibacteraceae bacterium]
MKKYSIKIYPEALSDIKSISVWYEEQKIGLGQRFQSVVKDQIDDLRYTPQKYAIRYREIRCMLIHKFPYMVHYYINTQTSVIEILAVISTSRNPKIWEEKERKI